MYVSYIYNHFLYYLEYAIDTPVSRGTYEKGLRLTGMRAGWKAGEGKKDNLVVMARASLYE